MLSSLAPRGRVVLALPIMDDCRTVVSIGFYSISDRPTLSQHTHGRLRTYCDTHGYALTIMNSTLDPSRHQAWSKLLLLRSALRRDEHDLYVWIDDDIYLTKPELRFEDLIAQHPFEHILVSEDVDAAHPMNTGMLVLKATAEVDAVLRNAYLLGVPLNLRWQSPWEQGALTHLFSVSHDAERPDPIFTLVPHTVLQSFHRDHDVPDEFRWRPGHFAAHMTGMPLERRLLCLQLLREVLGDTDPGDLDRELGDRPWPHAEGDANAFDPRCSLGCGEQMEWR